MHVACFCRRYLPQYARVYEWILVLFATFGFGLGKKRRWTRWRYCDMDRGSKSQDGEIIMKYFHHWFVFCYRIWHKYRVYCSTNVLIGWSVIRGILITWNRSNIIIVFTKLFCNDTELKVYWKWSENKGLKDGGRGNRFEETGKLRSLVC